jgi:hypothetical protein
VKGKDGGDVKNLQKFIKQHQPINWFKTPRLEVWPPSQDFEVLGKN